MPPTSETSTKPEGGHNMKTKEAMTRDLADLINEWRAAQDAAEAAKALVLECMEAHGITKAVAHFEDAAGVHVTTATYRAAGADTLTLDTKRLEADQPALYAAYKTKPRKGSAATVAFTRKLA